METLLFITPVLPDANGGGREKRAHQWLCQLSSRYEISLLLVGAEAKPELCEPFGIKDVQALPLAKERVSGALRWLLSLWLLLFGRGSTLLGWVPMPKEQREQLAGLYSQRTFDRILVFRLYLQDYAKFLCGLTQPRTAGLDMDDIESTTRLKIARLLLKRKAYKEAALHFLSAVSFRRAERKLRGFSTVYVCSPEDRALLLERAAPLEAEAEVMPNRIYGAPRCLDMPRSGCRILFVGSLAYYPNEEAVVWFIRQVLPQLRQRDTRWTLHVAGLGGRASFRQLLAETEGVTFHGYVPVLEEVYKEAGLVISPLHAGGGTKLKVMEALWFGRPLIATAESVHGLGLVPGLHYLAAETAGEYIDACLRLAGEPELAARLTTASARIVAERYTYE